MSAVPETYRPYSPKDPNSALCPSWSKIIQHDPEEFLREYLTGLRTPPFSGHGGRMHRMTCIVVSNALSAAALCAFPSLFGLACYLAGWLGWDLWSSRRLNMRRGSRERRPHFQVSVLRDSEGLPLILHGQYYLWRMDVQVPTPLWLRQPLSRGSHEVHSTWCCTVHTTTSHVLGVANRYL